VDSRLGGLGLSGLDCITNIFRLEYFTMNCLLDILCCNCCYYYYIIKPIIIIEPPDEEVFCFALLFFALLFLTPAL